MIINSDWHMHSEHSYDSTLEADTLVPMLREIGLTSFGITDHVNYNEECYFDAIRGCAPHVRELKKSYPELHLGVELTPINKPEFDYLAMHDSREGYIPPSTTEPYGIEVAMSAEELSEYGVEYVVGASHWRVDVADKNEPCELDKLIREWHRQQMWLANDERITILGHPWYNGRAAWYGDFSIIPRSMHDELFSALKENGKYMECNVDVLLSWKADERFHMQYAEFLREGFERGVPITYGSDSHNKYIDRRDKAEAMLSRVGFKEGDFSTLSFGE